MTNLPRILLALLLLAVAAFCGFGFMATYEPTDGSGFMAWRIGYGVVGVLCLGGAAWLLLARRRS
ncbi:MAG: hypothetical protein ACT4PU_06390 [Planctomycetota bacterium]